MVALAKWEDEPEPEPLPEQPPAPDPVLSRAQTILIAVALIVGCAVRFGWSLFRNSDGVTGEADYVARALATTGMFGDAFAIGQGPTAHLMPVSPFIASLAYRAFGIGPTALAVLCVWAVLVVTASFLLFARAARLSGMPRAAWVGGLVFVLAAPVYTAIESIDFRIWEGGLALALAGALLVAILSFEGRPVGRRAIVGVALLAALLFFTHPTLGLAGYAMLALFARRNLTVAQAGTAALAAAVALALFVVPWAIRNQRAMGEPILLRDNLGLELAVANYPANVDPANGDLERTQRLWDIHPFDHPGAYNRMRDAGGEVAYSKRLETRTLRWMRANPGSTARLFLRHLREMLFPPQWMFVTTHGVHLPWIRSMTVCTISALGLAGLWLGRRNPRLHYWTIFVTLVALAYVPFQPIGRYTWLLYVPMTYLAAFAVHRLWRTARA